MYGVPIAWVAEFLAKNGVQWPYRSKDVTGEDALRSMWEYILRKHWEQEKK